jgi:predicted transcriptional regulator of viral defense system
LRPTVDVFQACLKSSAKNLELLTSYAEQLENGAVFKRLGFLLERFAPMETTAIEACRFGLSTGNAKLGPSLPAARLVTRWKLWIPQNWTEELEND